MEWDDQLIDDALRRPDKVYPENLPHPDVIWAAIEAKRKRGKVVRIRKALAIAVSIAVLLSTAALWYFPKEGHMVQMPTGQDEAIAYIRQLCVGNNIVCASPAFNELQTELNTSSSELSAVNQQIRLYGNDEQLLRAKTRIENHQAKIVKAMVQLL